MDDLHHPLRIHNVVSMRDHVTHSNNGVTIGDPVENLGILISNPNQRLSDDLKQALNRESIAPRIEITLSMDLRTQRSCHKRARCLPGDDGFQAAYNSTPRVSISSNRFGFRIAETSTRSMDRPKRFLNSC